MSSLTLLLAAGGAALTLGFEGALRRRIVDSRWRERVSNAACSGLRYAVEAVLGGSLIMAHRALLRLAPLELDATSPWTWALAVVGYDFLYYWAHRAFHRVPMLWALHAVHHQPAHFGLTVGLRSSALTSFVLVPFFLPLAFLGIPTVVHAAVVVAHFSAMAWLHTALRPLPALESFLNTPALHRVHHSADPRHFDKNLGGVLVVWDRLFGTWAAPASGLSYGVPGARSVPSALMANFEPLTELTRSLRAHSSLAGKVRALFVARVGSAPRHRSLDILVVAVAVGIIGVGLVLRPISLPLFSCALVVAWLAADLASGFVHWFMDRHAASFSLLRPLAADFADHHARPGRCLTVSSFASVKAAAVATGALGSLVVIVTPSAFAATTLLLTLAVLMVAAELHKYAHRTTRRSARTLQRLGIIIGPRAHAVHHRGDHRRAYAVVSGFWNPLLDRLRLFERLDALIGRVPPGPAVSARRKRPPDGG